MYFPATRQSAPELAAKLALDNPPAYTTFQKVLPFCKVREKSGKITFMSAVDLSSTALTENRADGTALDSEAVVTGEADYTLGLYEKRTHISEQEESNYATEENVRNAGGTVLAQKFFLGLEAKFLSYLTTAKSATTQMTAGSVVSALQEACDAVAPYGEPVIILNRKAYRTLRAMDEVRELLFTSGKVSGNINFVTGNPTEFAKALADLLDIREVIVATNTVWTSDYDNQVFVTAVRPESLGSGDSVLDTIKAAPHVGFVPYVVNGSAEAADPYTCAVVEVWGDNDRKRDVFDATANLAFVCLDTDGVQRLKFPVA